MLDSVNTAMNDSRTVFQVSNAMVPGTPPNIKSTASAHGSESEEQFKMFTTWAFP